MIKAKPIVLSLALCIAANGSCRAAGNGAGAGGAGAQRAINSGLPTGDAGPPGAPNNQDGAKALHAPQSHRTSSDAVHGK